MSFLQNFLAMTIESEAPRSFFYWSALSAISAVARRNVWFERGGGLLTLYPNIYVMLLARSGLKKGVPIALVKRLLTKVNNTRVISGRSSIQAVITELGKAYTVEGVGVISEAHAILVNSEFASSIVSDPQALTILTDLYDSIYNDEWRNTLKGTGVDVLKKPCLTMLSASNPPLFNKVVTAIDMEGGFIGRTLLIFEEKKYRTNDLLDPPEIKYDTELLVRELKCISRKKGPMTLHSDAKKMYRNWYKEFDDKVHNDKTGTAERIPDHILKIAICISLSEREELVICQEDMELAIETVIGLTANVNKMSLGAGKSQLAPQTGLVIRELLQAKDMEVSRTKILQSNYGDIDATDLDRVVDSLLQAGAIEHERRGSQIYYKLKSGFAEQFKAFMESKGAKAK